MSFSLEFTLTLKAVSLEFHHASESLGALVPVRDLGVHSQRFRLSGSEFKTRNLHF